MILKMVIKICLIGTSLFAIYANVFHLLPPLVTRGISWGLIAIVVFLSSQNKRKVINIFLSLLVVFSTSLLLIRWEEFASGIHDITPIETAVALIMIFLVLEATRRTIGWFLTGVTIFFLLYALFGNYLPGVFVSKGYSVSRLASFIFWDANGIYGLPMYIAASYVMLFVIFGSFLLTSGGEKWFINLSFAAVGRLRGGPALTAVVSSAIFGMMSGSPVANVVTTGSFTIPLMKRIGFKSQFAGAVEAVASTGGMFTPPIMGAAAFLMAEYVGVPYITIAISAAIPAFLFYAALIFSVYLRAVKISLPTIEPKDIPSLRITLRDYGHLIPPIFILLGLIIAGWSLLWSAFWSIIAMVGLAMLRKNTRMSIFQIIETLRDSAEKVVPIFVACGSAGIIYGIISITGIGFQVSSLLLSLAGKNNILILLLTMGSALLLGFAMPPTAAYIILAALVIPSLKEAGLPLLVAHMFIFFFCSIGPITPPVALAAYSAAAIANADPNKTGFTAVRLGFPAFIIPFLFAYNPSLLLIGSLTQVLFSILKALVALLLLAASFEGYFLRRLYLYERILLFIILIIIMWSFI